MNRRDILKLLGVAVGAFFVPPLLIERSLTPQPIPLPRVLNPFQCWDEPLFCSPLQAYKYKQLGYTLRSFEGELVNFSGAIFSRHETDRRRIGRSIRKARREAALCRSAS